MLKNVIEPPISPEEFNSEILMDVLDTQDGIYYVIKNTDSVFIWVNQNFSDLIGVPKSDLIGQKDQFAAHVAHDKLVIASGKPILNLHETIPVPDGSGGHKDEPIVTQKGLWRDTKNPDLIKGITVCFSLVNPPEEA
ncbi:hypothetical protein CW749_05820 [Vibrio sp. vnigr-6D03]|uniref:PAS domain-containing protein n=1 Tax=Vibrio sp. vnigr-6D03 TaxID=2058088 RepID=UPI000C32AD77|nr:PAS domain-containing protein [Vibrio sp. vnigr-6D03]PKF80439.1 hypothetical protein CW749_05820 [Vibrio sp. vnigr-6D03]